MNTDIKTLNTLIWAVYCFEHDRDPLRYSSKEQLVGKEFDMYVEKVCNILKKYFGESLPNSISATTQGAKFKPSICEQANVLVYGDRQESYGHPIDDFSRTGKMLTGLLGHLLKDGASIGPELVPLIMIVVKLSRQIHKAKEDNLVDIAGYAETCNMVHEKILQASLDELDIVETFGNLNSQGDDK